MVLILGFIYVGHAIIELLVLWKRKEGTAKSNFC